MMMEIWPLGMFVAWMLATFAFFKIPIRCPYIKGLLFLYCLIPVYLVGDYFGVNRWIFFFGLPDLEAVVLFMAAIVCGLAIRYRKIINKWVRGYG